MSRPDNYLKGCESAGLVRQKANSEGGKEKEGNKIRKSRDSERERGKGKEWRGGMHCAVSV